MNEPSYPAQEGRGFLNQEEGHSTPVTQKYHGSDGRRHEWQPASVLDGSRATRTATLLEHDITLDSSGLKDHPKLEGSYNSRGDSPDSPTCFHPPLYLKCGPLLRFTGIYKRSIPPETSNASQHNRDIWRGSIMILTDDSKSSYETLPTLQLFHQQKDIPPHNPTDTALKYNDPGARQVKMSRVGRTLFVKPVQALNEGIDHSLLEDDSALFEEKDTSTYDKSSNSQQPGAYYNENKRGEPLGKFCEISGSQLHAERGVTFWKFNLEIELASQEARIAYRINHGPAIGFWLPARGQTMNIMFHSCNGFSLGVDSHPFSGPDPLWRDVLNAHHSRPFHVMIGGGDQIYNDECVLRTRYFKKWTRIKNRVRKRSESFSREMQDELEDFYLNHYAMWFSQGLFSVAISQIPMINIWDDHDIIDGYGSYRHRTMASPVFTGLGAVAFKYYLLFQHQSVPEEAEQEPSWLLGATPGQYIGQLSRSVFMFLGPKVAFLGLDCRTERTRDKILCQDTWNLVFERCMREIVETETKHLIVLLGVPIAYPRLTFLENILASKYLFLPLKALGRAGMFGSVFNKFDGGFEILDDLDDHWTTKHHCIERKWFIQQLQHIAAEKSVRITILGGDVHLAALGQFHSNRKLGVPKDCDHRYMPNVISSAIVNRPPAAMLANMINRFNKVHRLDEKTEEEMAAMFPNDTDGKPRRNTHLLPHRNWCAIREHSEISPAEATLTSCEDISNLASMAHGLDVRLNVEKVQGNPSGETTIYSYLIPALHYRNS